MLNNDETERRLLIALEIIKILEDGLPVSTLWENYKRECEDVIRALIALGTLEIDDNYQPILRR